MRKISFWAKHHRLQAIAFLVIIKLLLALIAFYIGLSLLDLDIYIPFFVFAIALFILIIAALIYPSRHLTRLSKNQFYIRQKSCDFIIAACSFVMIGTLVNNNFPLPGTTISLASNVTAIKPTAEEILASLQYRDKSTLTKQEKRILKEEFMKQLKVYAVAKVTGNTSDAGKAGLIILTIVAALGLLYLVAALACTLSCNGSDAAAIIVVILGTAIVVWGTVTLIRRILHGPKKKKEESSGSN
jgi:fatty acid desaturase